MRRIIYLITNRKFLAGENDFVTRNVKGLKCVYNPNIIFLKYQC